MSIVSPVSIRPLKQVSYSLGVASLPVLLVAFPLYFVSLGYASNLSNALAASSIIGLIIFAIVGRRLIIDNLLVIRVAPPITTRWKQAVVSAVAFGATALTYKIVVIYQLALPFLATTSSGFQLGLLGGSAVAEETFFRYFLETSVYVSLLLVTGHRVFSGTGAIGISAFGWYAFHYYVYGNVSLIAQWVLITGLIFGAAYLLTGNLLVTMLPHFWWNTALILLQLLGIMIPGVTS